MDSKRRDISPGDQDNDGLRNDGVGKSEEERDIPDDDRVIVSQKRYERHNEVNLEQTEDPLNAPFVQRIAENLQVFTRAFELVQ